MPVAVMGSPLAWCCVRFADHVECNDASYLNLLERLTATSAGRWLRGLAHQVCLDAVERAHPGHRLEEVAGFGIREPTLHHAHQGAAALLLEGDLHLGDHDGPAWITPGGCRHEPARAVDHPKHLRLAAQ